MFLVTAANGHVGVPSLWTAATSAMTQCGRSSLLLRCCFSFFLMASGDCLRLRRLAMADVSEGEKLKVFISYSRRDSAAFADELVAGLELAGFAPFLDRHDIAAGEDWERRLGGLIQQADTVVYVISPEAVKSERCGWEGDRTLALSKRLSPRIYKPGNKTDIPERLRRLQFVRFDGGLGINRPLTHLAEALRQDLNWIREHTRIAELAARWQARGRPSSLLLRGDDLVAAKTWAAKRKPEAP